MTIGKRFSTRLARLALAALAGGLFPNLAAAQAFSTVPAGFLGLDSGCPAWGDYDNDGDLDVYIQGADIAAAGRAKIYRNNGDGTFAENTTASLVLTGLSSNSRNQAVWADFDNDGDLDLLATGLHPASNTGRTILYRNDGNDEFTDLGNRAMAQPNSNGVLAAADYDGDGRLDIFLAAGTTNYLYRNTGSNNFTETAMAGTGTSFGGAAWGDYDDDGRPDLLVAGTSGGTPELRLYHNDGGGAFTLLSPVTPFPGVIFGGCSWGDYDGDGDLDIVSSGVYTSSFQPAVVYRNNGDGTFTDIAAALPAIYQGSCVWGDYDNDGDLDLSVSGQSPGGNVHAVYTNDSGTFTLLASSGLLAMRTTNAAWGDFDGDTKLDLIITGIDDTVALKKTILYRNMTSNVNAAPSAPAGLSSSIDGLAVTFSWNASTDDLTSSTGLSYNLRVGTASGAVDTVVPAALTGAGTRTVAETGNAGQRLSRTVSGLASGATYYWSVQAIDSAFRGSGFAAESVTGVVPVTLSAMTAE